MKKEKKKTEECPRCQSCFDAAILFFPSAFDWQICQHCHFSLTVSLLCSLTEISFDYLPLTFRCTEPLLESQSEKTAHSILHSVYKCNYFNAVGFSFFFFLLHPSLQWFSPPEWKYVLKEQLLFVRGYGYQDYSFLCLYSNISAPVCGGAPSYKSDGCTLNSWRAVEELFCKQWRETAAACANTPN